MRLDERLAASGGRRRHGGCLRGSRGLCGGKLDVQLLLLLLLLLHQLLRMLHLLHLLHELRGLLCIHGEGAAGSVGCAVLTNGERRMTDGDDDGDAAHERAWS